MSQLKTALRNSWLARRYLLTASKGSSNYTNDSQPVALFIRGRALARSGFRSLGANLLHQAYSADPTLIEAMEDHGALLDMMGERKAAEAKYDEARSARKASWTGPPDRHFVFRHRGSVISEIIAYDSVLTSIRKNALPYVARGNAYLSSGHPQRALKDYEKALKLKQHSPGTVALKGEALSVLGRYQEALQAFDAALAERPDDGEALNSRAIVQSAIGAIDKANADWRLQFQLVKGRPPARACIALRMADYELALPELEQTLSREPLEPYWSLYRLTARRRLGLTGAVNDLAGGRDWPGMLLSLHAGRVTAEEVLGRADTEARRAEALFQAGVVAFANDRSIAERYWQQVLDHGAPSLIEYGAARNELARLAS